MTVFCFSLTYFTCVLFSQPVSERNKLSSISPLPFLTLVRIILLYRMQFVCYKRTIEASSTFNMTKVQKVRIGAQERLAAFARKKISAEKRWFWVDSTFLRHETIAHLLLFHSMVIVHEPFPSDDRR
ncbi:hypothetical protein BD560DRAFT_423326 [Blakeslea trispora]|nr:hypothetical protein BD560DRAFT_423326 [Blakeslea trispora]